ncbi:MAG TPA: hypothetical protein ENN07_05175 [candidate division Zixibacteria bacterium]|mgnify:CR=1 FL=1|nr:hypothetical protein [candidate division Zixibacteria bacterium]
MDNKKHTLKDDLRNDDITAADLKPEFGRKAVHLFALIIPILYLIVPHRPAMLILASFAFASILMDLLKYYDRRFRLLYLKIGGKMLREHEVKRFTASSYILSAALISFFVFDTWVAIIVITYIILGDTAAAFFGIRFGKHKTINDKTLEGSIAFFLSAYFGAIAFKLFAGLSAPWSAVFTGALVATVVESLPLGIDDNFTVPLLTGVLLQLLFIGHF